MNKSGLFDVYIYHKFLTPNFPMKQGQNKVFRCALNASVQLRVFKNFLCEKYVRVDEKFLSSARVCASLEEHGPYVLIR